MDPRADDLQEVLASARELAEALECSDRAIALKAAKRAVEDEVESLELFQRFDQAGQQLRRKVLSGEPPTEMDKLELDHIKREVCEDPLLWDLLRCQADYVEMMSEIDGILFRTVPRMGLRIG